MILMAQIVILIFDIYIFNLKIMSDSHRTASIITPLPQCVKSPALFARDFPAPKPVFPAPRTRHNPLCA